MQSISGVQVHSLGASRYEGLGNLLGNEAALSNSSEEDWASTEKTGLQNIALSVLENCCYNHNARNVSPSHTHCCSKRQLQVRRDAPSKGRWRLIHKISIQQSRISWLGNAWKASKCLSAGWSSDTVLCLKTLQLGSWKSPRRTAAQVHSPACRRSNSRTCTRVELIE